MTTERLSIACPLRAAAVDLQYNETYGGGRLFKQRVKLSMAQVRELFPNRAPNAEWKSEGNEIHIMVHRSPSRLVTLLSRFFRIPLKKRFCLDEFGTFVWTHCDGRTRAGEIVTLLSQRTGWSEERTERAVLQFLSMLSERRLVGFANAPPGK